jgi:hypothetical protein
MGSKKNDSSRNKFGGKMLKSNPIIQERELQEGVYLSYYSFQLHALEGRNSGYSRDPEFPSNDIAWYYGVCDRIDNLLEFIPELTSTEREFVVLLHKITKSDQPNEGGWRWHKWGDYIGTQTPTTEYIYDEPEIEVVYCYHIYEKIK